MSEVEIRISGELDVEVADRLEDFIRILTGDQIERVLNMLTLEQSRALTRAMNASLRRVRERQRITREDLR